LSIGYANGLPPIRSTANAPTAETTTSIQRAGS